MKEHIFLSIQQLVDSGVFQLATRFPIYLPDSVRQSNGEVENKPQGDNVPSIVPPTYF